MKKVLGFVVLFAFIFSSCATAPVTDPVAKNGYKPTITFAVKGYERFGFLDLKASESADDGEPGTGSAQQSSDSSSVAMTIGVLGALGLGGWFAYKYITDPDFLDFSNSK